MPCMNKGSGHARLSYMHVYNFAKYIGSTTKNDHAHYIIIKLLSNPTLYLTTHNMCDQSFTGTNPVFLESDWEWVVEHGKQKLTHVKHYVYTVELQQGLQVVNDCRIDVG